MQKLLLIDGNAILHRAFHAYPPSFSDREGNPTNAIYGFYAMLLKVIAEVKPDLLTICFDRGAPTFRMNMYAGYHANRPKMADTLAPQVPRLQESLEKIGIPIEGIDGYEADDLIGSLSTEAKNAGFDVIILTGDRDLLQLVNGQVKLLMPITGITKSILMGAKDVEEKYGIRPDQVIDYKALVGDPSDNYPGVMGIGPKTASNLLKQFDTLENIYTHLGKIKPELSQKLAQDAEQAMLCKKLATIHLDVPVHLEITRANIKNFEIEKFLEVFEQFNIHSLVKRLGDALGEEVKETKMKGERKEDSSKTLLSNKNKTGNQLELL